MTLPLPTNPRRLAYLGTPHMAVPTFEALVDAGYEITLVVTGEDARRARRGDPEPSPVKRAALARGIPVSSAVADLLEVQADLGVVVAYGKLIPTAVLDVLPMVNLHFSLLPRWRGAAPVERALLEGDEHTGVCVMDVVDALDEGSVYSRREMIIGADATLESLRGDLVAIGTDLLLGGLRDGFGEPIPQRGPTTYAHKITNADRRIDLDADSATLRRLVALGGAWTTFRGKRFKIWRIHSRVDGEPGYEPGTLLAPENGMGPRVALAREWVELVEVQPEGKARMDATAWANGARIAPGELLGS